MSLRNCGLMVWSRSEQFNLEMRELHRPYAATTKSQHSLACLRRSVSVCARRTKSCTSLDFQAAPTLGQAAASDSVLRSATANGRALSSLARPLGATSTID